VVMGSRRSWRRAAGRCWWMLRRQGKAISRPPANKRGAELLEKLYGDGEVDADKS